MATNVKVTSNALQAKSLMDKNIGKALTMLGLKFIEIATMEADDLIYTTPESPNYTRTGHYRQGMTFEPDIGNQLVKVGNNVEYAQYIEFGTSQMPARPVISNAILNYRDDYQEIVTSVLGEGFDVFTKGP